MAHIIRSLVSAHKQRYIDGQYNLDLSYVTERIIAMSWPSEGPEGLYRNHISDVSRMLNQKHPHHFKVYNLCRERTYDEAKFGGAPVVWYPFSDHHVPPLELLFDFLEDAAMFLDTDPLNVVVVHCKAGKGRTGLCVSCLLLRMGICDNWVPALAHFAAKRTTNASGVTIASQRRWVQYYDTIREAGSIPNPAPIHLTSIVLRGVPLHLAKRIVVIVQRRAYMKSACGGKNGYTEQDAVSVCEPGRRGWVNSSFRQILGCAGGPLVPGLPGSLAPVKSGEGLDDTANVEVVAWARYGNNWRLLHDGVDCLRLELDGNGAKGVELSGDFKIHVYLDRPTKGNSMFFSWLHTSFMTDSQLVLHRKELDKVSKQTPQGLSMEVLWTPDSSVPVIRPLPGAFEAEARVPGLDIDAVLRQSLDIENAASDPRLETVCMDSSMCSDASSCARHLRSEKDGWRLSEGGERRPKLEGRVSAPFDESFLVELLEEAWQGGHTSSHLVDRSACSCGGARAAPELWRRPFHPLHRLSCPPGPDLENANVNSPFNIESTFSDGLASHIHLTTSQRTERGASPAARNQPSSLQSPSSSGASFPSAGQTCVRSSSHASVPGVLPSARRSGLAVQSPQRRRPACLEAYQEERTSASAPVEAALLGGSDPLRPKAEVGSVGDNMYELVADYVVIDDSQELGGRAGVTAHTSEAPFSPLRRQASRGKDPLGPLLDVGMNSLGSAAGKQTPQLGKDVGYESMPSCAQVLLTLAYETAGSDAGDPLRTPTPPLANAPPTAFEVAGAGLGA